MTTSKEYWAQREAEQLQHNLTEEEAYSKKLQKIYQDAYTDCEATIESWYSRFAGKEGITLAEARRRVSKLDIEEYERKAKRYVEQAQADRVKYGHTKDSGEYFSKLANQQMRIYNATMRINRLELLKAEIGTHLVAMADHQEEYLSDKLERRATDEYKRQAGILGKTVKDIEKRANALVNASFQNATFSQRIWANQAFMRADLAKEIERGLIQGKNARALTKTLREKYWKPDSGIAAQYSAERLMRTELARVQAAAQLDSIAANKFTQYQWHALGDGHTCSTCRSMDGRVFNIDDAKAADNLPPLHPNCRCAISAYEDMDAYEAWIDAKASGEFEGSFGEWQNKIEKSEGNAKITVGRSVGAAAKKYPVKLLGSNQHAALAEGQGIAGKVFAGKGTGKELKDKYRLESTYHVSADEWSKVSGNGYIIMNGEKCLAELHWYEANGETYEIKVKRYLT